MLASGSSLMGHSPVWAFGQSLSEEAGTNHEESRKTGKEVGVFSVFPVFLLSSLVRKCLARQVESDEALVFKDAAVRRAQVLAQRRVMVQPPERRPAEDEEPDPLPSQPFQFPDGGGVVRRRPPVQSVPFQERDR